MPRLRRAGSYLGVPVGQGLHKVLLRQVSQRRGGWVGVVWSKVGEWAGGRVGGWVGALQL